MTEIGAKIEGKDGGGRIKKMQLAMGILNQNDNAHTTNEVR